VSLSRSLAWYALPFERGLEIERAKSKGAFFSQTLSNVSRVQKLAGVCGAARMGERYGGIGWAAGDELTGQWGGERSRGRRGERWGVSERDWWGMGNFGGVY